MATVEQTKAEALATQEQALPAHHLALIGLFGARDDMQALVRLASGRIKQVKPGARLPIGHVVAIDAEGVVIQHSGKTSRLSMLAEH